MFHYPSEAEKPAPKTVYYSKAGVLVESRAISEADNERAADFEQIVDHSKQLFESAVSYLGTMCRQREELLAVKVSIAVTMSLPQLTPMQMQHAIFTKQLFLEGEIAFADYLTKMRNLFPDRIAVLPRELEIQLQPFFVE